MCDDYFQVGETGELCLIPGRQGLRDVVKFSPPGTYQFRKADYPWLARVRVRVQAAGGGSAGAAAGEGLFMGHPGGAGGGYSESLLDVSALGPVETVVVGAGGTAGAFNSDGGNGDNSSFGGLVTANGGAGGQNVMPAGNTPICFSGTNGPLAGTGQIAMGGGAGGGAFRINGDQGQSGEGGESKLGHGGNQRTTSGSGGAGRGYGGGAAGSVGRAGNSVPGTPGMDGVVVVELYG
ncbi:glycine-rich domain-containing protein [Streptomyces fuscigenes]|uniref:glycine-rich domain-containing protein n=1 Tax=Streptomyces fuscigenes TaxID=1528880 RepID=UPI001F48D4B0|nr:hypothetical protein [Streptomyces fuscigenes]MCF3960602.1 hypothetical protein [Streptomyces fuscigenes]